MLLTGETKGTREDNTVSGRSIFEMSDKVTMVKMSRSGDAEHGRSRILMTMMP